MSRQPSRLLIIKLSALGDIVQTLPVLHAFKQSWPQCSIDWITGEVGASLLEGHPLIERVFVYPRRRLGRLAKSPLSWPRLAQELAGLRQKLSSRNYDLAVDFQGLFKSGIIALLSGAKTRAGFDKAREFSHLFLNKKIPPYNPDRHAVLRYLDLARAVGAAEVEPKFLVPLTEKDKNEARQLLDSLGIKPERFVVLIPGTVWPTKRWVNASFAQVATLIHKELGLESVIVGASGDNHLGQEIERLSGGRARNITGRTSLKTLSALFTMAVTGVSTDTGPMHLAAATGLPIVAIFGPTAPWRTGPFGRGHIVLRKKLDCSPCFKRNCSHNSCMKAVGAQEAFNAVKELCKTRFFK
ncbi:MAG: lipopolysaccharide heptosyltransferase II [Thermodesulfobacteria bacterium]|nr:lipopolysaccharide heptosyltransferase II [Thermodesulfobacteriota bacterium]